MKKHLSKTIYLLVVLFLAPLTTTAESIPPQEINVTINKDYTATGTWRIPILSTSGESRIGLPDFLSYGSAYSTRYTLNGVTNGNKEKMAVTRERDEVLSVSPSQGDRKTLSIYANYTLTPAFTQPAAIYEFWIYGDAYRLAPTLNITFPENWKVLTYWPDESVISGNKINLAYPSKYPDTKPVIVVFQTSEGGVVEKYGKYTITGTKSQVQKIKAALAKLSFVDDLLMQTVGIKTPDNVLIVVDDVTKSGSLGYKIEALASKPNLVVFNSWLLTSKTTNEIAETLAHELLHVAMTQLDLFQGREYSAPWIDEGIAVFFQAQAHKKIFTDKTERILNEELGRTYIVSPKEAESLYESKFDYTFDGSRSLGTSASYRHAGILFANFYNKEGLSGFKELFKTLSVHKKRPDGIVDEEEVKNVLKNISGLSEDELLYPGESSNTITQTISKIERPENDEDEGAKIVTDYIKKDIKHYFSEPGTVTPTTAEVPEIIIPPAPPVVPPTTVPAVIQPLPTAAKPAVIEPATRATTPTKTAGQISEKKNIEEKTAQVEASATIQETLENKKVAEEPQGQPSTNSGGIWGFFKRMISNLFSGW